MDCDRSIATCEDSSGNKSHGRKRHIELDIVRVLALIAVVAIHIFAPVLLEQAEVGSSMWAVANGIDSFLRPAVPLFVMVSGAVMLDPEKHEPIFRLWSKRISRLVAAFLIWSVVYAIYGVIDGSVVGISAFVQRVLTGEFHLWFLIMLIPLYALVPVLKKLASDPKLCLYSAVLFLCLSACSVIVSFFNSASFVGQVLSSWLDDLSLFPGYIGYFLIGRFLFDSMHSEGKGIYQGRILKPLLLCGIIWLFGLFATYFMTDLLSTQAGHFIGSAYEYLSPTVVIMSISMFIAAELLHYGFEAMISGRLRDAVTLIAQHSLGIYLVHYLMILMIDRIIPVNYGLWLPFKMAAVFILSACVAIGVRQIPMIGRVIS